MNDNLNDVLNRFSEILKEKGIDINNITGGANSAPPADNTTFGLDVDTILKIKEIIQKLNENQNCPRNKLLYSLKPYLEPSKRNKLNQYIKIASIIDLLDSMDFGTDFLKGNKNGYDYILIITLCLLIF